MEQLLQAAADYYVITVLGGCIAIGTLMKSVTSMVTTCSLERSRREIAAYIAEGSMSPEQGDRLMRAEINTAKKCAA